MIIPLSQINKKSPYYPILKEMKEKNAPTKTDWKILKVQLAGIYYIMQTIILYLKLKQKLLKIFTHSKKMNKNK